MSWTTLKAYWTAQIATAVSNGNLEEPYNLEAEALLDRWIDAETAADNASATDISSYTIAGRTVSRRGVQDFKSIAVTAKRNFMSMMYSDVSYADFRQTDDTTGTQ